MIHMVCPNCGKKLHAKDELAGRTARCPNCREPVLIQAVAGEYPETIPLDDAELDEHVIPASEERLPTHDMPDRLNRESHYLICDKTQLMALWENNGIGWMIRAAGGFLPAKRSRDNLPTEGNFQLVELKFAITPEGKRLLGIACLQLVTRWALTALNQSDDAIMVKVTGPGCLNRDQKNAVRLALREQFMRPVWQDATEVLEYLGNTDFHSHGVG